MKAGIKHDKTKPRWSLIPAKTLTDIIDVLEYGAQKYTPDNWQIISDSITRYYDAAMRHIEARIQGEINDKESGKPHLAHAVCCLLFMMWFDRRDRRGRKKSGHAKTAQKDCADV